MICIYTICCFQYDKDTFLKANHNSFSDIPTNKELFPIRQRYIFESKSQLAFVLRGCIISCFQYDKDTFLKANHNTITPEPIYSQLFPIRQRYIFESKSQPGLPQ